MKNAIVLHKDCNGKPVSGTAANLGDLRIVEDLMERATKWPWRYHIERYEGGSFLFWTWPPKWKFVMGRLEYDQAVNAVEVLRKNERSRVVG